MANERGSRADFPLLAENPVIYLDNAATTQRPACVIAAEAEFYQKYNANPLRGLYDLGMAATDRYEEAREAVRDFIHAPTEASVIFTRNSTESLNLVAYSYGLSHLKPGDEILVSIAEHHSNFLPWQMVARQTGATLRYLECDPDGGFSKERLDEGFSDRTRLVAVTHISNVTGRESPVAEIVARAHHAGAVVVLDAAQSAPHRQIDVQKLDVDFLVFSGHKLLGPMGIGVLYGREELLAEMPPFLTGGEMIDSVTREGAVWAELPHKFEAGTVNAAGAWGLHAAIGYILDLGYDEIQRREAALTKQAFDGLRAIPHVTIQGSNRAEEHCGILSFTLDGVHPHDVSSILDADGIAVRSGHHCAQPLLKHLGVTSTTRASLAFYNTAEEVEAFLESVASIRERMGYGA